MLSCCSPFKHMLMATCELWMLLSTQPEMLTGKCTFAHSGKNSYPGPERVFWHQLTKHSQTRIADHLEVQTDEQALEYVVRKISGRVRLDGGLYGYKLDIVSGGTASTVVLEYGLLDSRCQQAVCSLFGADAEHHRWQTSKSGRPRSRRGRRKHQSQRKSRHGMQGTKPNAAIFDEDDRSADIPSQLDFGSADLASDCHDSVESDWSKHRHDQQMLLDSFPQVASEDRIKHSLSHYRELVSQPHVDLGACCVCGERFFTSLLKSFALRKVHSHGKRKRQPAHIINPELLQAMQSTLAARASLPDDFNAMPDGFETLRGLALCRDGFNTLNRTISVCIRCYQSLQFRRQRPLISLANDLVFGDIPEELTGLSWAEERLIALYRVHVHILRFSSQHPQSESQSEIPKLKAHSFCVPQDSIAINELLPPHPNKLAKYIQVRSCAVCFAQRAVCL